MANSKGNIEISDDDDSFSLQDDSILISSDEDNTTVPTENCLTSDDELPSVEMQAKKLAAIKKLFPTTAKKDMNNDITANSSKNQMKNDVKLPSNSTEKPKEPGVNRMIEGVNVNLPVNPYGCQVALMSMVSRYCSNEKMIS